MTDDTHSGTDAPKKNGWLSRLGQKLGATRQSLGAGLGNLLLGRKQLDQELIDDLEDILLTADIGIDATGAIISDITGKIARKELSDPEAVYRAIQAELEKLLLPCQQALTIPEQTRPYIIMMVGVNGVGKTTTTGKITHRLKQQGFKVVLAAGDTFRAAAVEQLQQWGQRNDVDVIAQPTGADAASVAHDAVEAARARRADVLIIDTAGRQHTHSDLMQELQKIKRVINKLDNSAPHEVMLTLDAGTGQNALSQLEHFNNAVGVTGINLTKLDGTAKGGIIVAIARRFGIPVRFIGVGESAEDLRPFDATEFIHALFDNQERG
ncbi:MAG: signal recognition particle-docking protein FtsY [Gammaproteobacteria bacterium]|nr:signal recognition particle-docking protein FtsY [Gammaproteobacteria bacterium]